ncbi:hypothetical protein P8835_20360 [Bacillus spizizenii]|nr:hypothetical protein [Bacillus spizizenii]
MPNEDYYKNESELLNKVLELFKECEMYIMSVNKYNISNVNSYRKYHFVSDNNLIYCKKQKAIGYKEKITADNAAKLLNIGICMNCMKKLIINNIKKSG